MVAFKRPLSRRKAFRRPACPVLCEVPAPAKVAWHLEDADAFYRVVGGSLSSVFGAGEVIAVDSDWHLPVGMGTMMLAMSSGRVGILSVFNRNGVYVAVTGRGQVQLGHIYGIYLGTVN
jgi:hypothetical protein